MKRDKPKTVIPPVTTNGKESITGGKAERLPIKIDEEMLPKLQVAYAQLAENARQLELQNLRVEAQRQNFNAVVYQYMLESSIPKDYILDPSTWMFVKNGKREGESGS